MRKFWRFPTGGVVVVLVGAATALAEGQNLFGSDLINSVFWLLAGGAVGLSIWQFGRFSRWLFHWMMGYYNELSPEERQAAIQHYSRATVMLVDCLVIGIPAILFWQQVRAISIALLVAVAVYVIWVGSLALVNRKQRQPNHYSM